MNREDAKDAKVTILFFHLPPETAADEVRRLFRS
jgi:hypothetical protein